MLEALILKQPISLAVHAMEKMRVNADIKDLKITIEPDLKNHILKITDTGIGMTRQDLINNLGTIVRPGTFEFLTKLEDSSSASEMSDLIDQFGVGLYSAFTVANKIVVTSKSDQDKQYMWTSDLTSVVICEDPKGPTLKRGTQISFYLNKDSYHLLKEEKIISLTKQYFINFKSEKTNTWKLTKYCEELEPCDHLPTNNLPSKRQIIKFARYLQRVDGKILDMRHNEIGIFSH